MFDEWFNDEFLNFYNCYILLLGLVIAFDALESSMSNKRTKY